MWQSWCTGNLPPDRTSHRSSPLFPIHSHCFTLAVSSARKELFCRDLRPPFTQFLLREAFTDRPIQNSAPVPLHRHTHSHTVFSPSLFPLWHLSRPEVTRSLVYSLPVCLSPLEQKLHMKGNIGLFVHYYIPRAGHIKCSINTCWMNKLVNAYGNSCDSDANPWCIWGLEDVLK